MSVNSDNEFSTKELLKIINSNHEKVITKLESIHTQVVRTNGRVTTLESIKSEDRIGCLETAKSKTVGAMWAFGLIFTILNFLMIYFFNS